MSSDWISLHAIPPSGKDFVLEDQAVWTAPLAEFSMACSIVEPLRAAFRVQVQEDGVLIHGRVTGTVALPCDRCMENALVAVDQRVDTFEPFPDEDAPDEDVLDADRELLRPSPSGKGMEINLAALAWEEFSLALPMKPLCGDACLGLCPACGANRNTAPCGCEQDELDPRMAPLRGLKVSPK